MTYPYRKTYCGQPYSIISDQPFHTNITSHLPLDKSTRSEANHLSAAAAFRGSGELLPRLLHQRSIHASHALLGGGNHREDYEEDEVNRVVVVGEDTLEIPIAVTLNKHATTEDPI